METKEVKIQVPEGYEIDKENSTFEHIKFKKKNEVNTWKDIQYINGIFIEVNSDLIPIMSDRLRCNEDKNVFYSEKYAKAALALAQISQLMPYYGGEVTDEEWKNDEWKYCVLIDKFGIYYHAAVKVKYLIAFHTKEQRDRFLSFPENVQLVKDLYMVD